MKPVLCIIEEREVHAGDLLYITWGDNTGSVFIPDRVIGSMLASGRMGCLIKNLSWTNPLSPKTEEVV
jgi:hypothetical protein